MKVRRMPLTASPDPAGMNPGRRRFLGVAAAGVLAAAGINAGSVLATPQPQPLRTRARVVVVGAGAAGIALVNRLARVLDGASITLIDSREVHHYQPGLTLVATGAWKSARVVDRNVDFIPRGVTWVRESVVAYEPERNRVRTASGDDIEYDYLLVATGLQLNFDAIEGMNPSLIGTNGIACVYDTPQHAVRTREAIERFVASGGVGLFTTPPGAIKCAGAPLKVSMLTEHALRESGMRDRAQLAYLAPGTTMFSQPRINDFLKGHFPRHCGIDVAWEHRLTAIEPGSREATFDTPEGVRTIPYDFIHVVPPMSAADSVRASDLAWRDGAFAGWLEVDRHTLRHRRYPNVFGAGDVVGTPVGKTAASVKAQVPVVVSNLVSVLRDETPGARYNGYTSCPLLLERGRGMLVEFDYDLNMVPSFDFIDPFEAYWTTWFMKDRMLHAAYNAMLRGRI